MVWVLRRLLDSKHVNWERRGFSWGSVRCSFTCLEGLRLFSLGVWIECFWSFINNGIEMVHLEDWYFQNEYWDSQPFMDGLGMDFWLSGFPVCIRCFINKICYPRFSMWDGCPLMQRTDGSISFIVCGLFSFIISLRVFAWLGKSGLC